MPHRLIGLNTWSLADEPVWAVALLEEVGPWGWALRFQKTQASPSVSLYTCKLYI